MTSSVCPFMQYKRLFYQNVCLLAQVCSFCLQFVYKYALPSQFCALLCLFITHDLFLIQYKCLLNEIHALPPLQVFPFHSYMCHFISLLWLSLLVNARRPFPCALLYITCPFFMKYFSLFQMCAPFSNVVLTFTFV